MRSQNLNVRILASLFVACATLATATAADGPVSVSRLRSELARAISYGDLTDRVWTVYATPAESDCTDVKITPKGAFSVAKSQAMPGHYSLRVTNIAALFDGNGKLKPVAIKASACKQARGEKARPITVRFVDNRGQAINVEKLRLSSNVERFSFSWTPEEAVELKEYNYEDITFERKDGHADTEVVATLSYRRGGARHSYSVAIPTTRGETSWGEHLFETAKPLSVAGPFKGEGAVVELARSKLADSITTSGRIACSNLFNELRAKPSVVRVESFDIVAGDAAAQAKAARCTKAKGRSHCELASSARVRCAIAFRERSLEIN